MKTIEIQKSTNFSPFLNESIFVFVNGERYFMRHQSLKVDVADDKPFEVRVKKTWSGSPSYTFNPKEDLVLLVSENMRWQNILAVFFMVVLGTLFVLTFLKESYRFFPYVQLSLLLSYFAILFTVKRKKGFVIRKINVEKSNENNKRC